MSHEIDFDELKLECLKIELTTISQLLVDILMGYAAKPDQNSLTSLLGEIVASVAENDARITKLETKETS